MVTMKLWIVSDLHTDHYPWMPSRVPEHDVMIIAGDLGDGALDAIGELLRIRRRAQRPIVFVPGNHDFFGDGLDRFDDVKVAGVNVLSSGQSGAIDGVRFVGATLWTDWHLHDTEFASQSWASDV
jgi:3',5'-cyclic AMP phosphodiesterase CpdA